MGVTIRERSCPLCPARFIPVGRQRYCSARCRQRAYLRRRAAAASPGPAMLSAPGRAASVYECPECAARYLDEQRCPECNTFCRRIGVGGPCPHCDEPVAAADLLDPAR
jgi:hypothetical protein